MTGCGAIMPGVTIDGEPLRCRKDVAGVHRGPKGIRFVIRQAGGQP